LKITLIRGVLFLTLVIIQTLVLNKTIGMAYQVVESITAELAPETVFGGCVQPRVEVFPMPAPTGRRFSKMKAQHGDAAVDPPSTKPILRLLQRRLSLG
jgi:hypothetical protein